MHGFRVKGGTARRVAAVAILSLAAIAVAASMGSAHRTTAAAARMVPDTLRGPGAKQISYAKNPTGKSPFDIGGQPRFEVLPLLSGIHLLDPEGNLRQRDRAKVSLRCLGLL